MPSQTGSILRELATLRRSLRAVDRSLRRLAPKFRSALERAGRPGQAPRVRRLNLSPQRKAQLKLQGKYMGYVRQLRPKQKEAVRKVLETSGMNAAIARARKLMSGPRAA